MKPFRLRLAAGSESSWLGNSSTLSLPVKSVSHCSNSGSSSDSLLGEETKTRPDPARALFVMGAPRRAQRRFSGELLEGS